VQLNLQIVSKSNHELMQTTKPISSLIFEQGWPNKIWGLRRKFYMGHFYM